LFAVFLYIIEFIAPTFGPSQSAWATGSLNC